jgi:formylglycine-generating enzyme required for sulfatase activity
MRLRVGFWGMLLSTVLVSGHAAETWREPNTGMEFVQIPKGCFQMGLPANAFADDETALFLQRIRTEMPQHEVCVDEFWLGRYEVRASEWQKIMGQRDSSNPANAPVAGITWEEANAFARRLTELSGGSERLRLPTEAEWEYSCRAGSPAITRTLGRDVLNEKAWFSSPYLLTGGERLKTIQPVGQKAVNAFGLYDMLGNVWEWVQDNYRSDAYAKHSLYNPVITGPEKIRVIRGGGLRTDRRMTRCETRGWMPAQETQDTIGLRLVRIR